MSPVAVLIGPPGAGKSTVGALLAQALGTAFRDTDEEVAVAAGKPVGDIFVEDGEEAFRELERAAARKALAEHEGVLALGSGAILDPDVRETLTGTGAGTGTGTAQPVVYLAADFRTVARRAGLERPRVVLPGNPRGRLRALLEDRRPLYEALATITVQADDGDAAGLAAQIAAELSRGAR